MMRDFSLRSFKGGSWDLRKEDRRRMQLDISFPDRRRSDRRSGSPAPVQEDGELTWVSPSALDG
jgi:hypothetical protein